MKKLLFIILILLLLTSCMTSYTVNSEVEETPISLGFGGSYIYHSNPSDFGLGFNIDLSFEFFESKTADEYSTFRVGPNLEYRGIIISIDFNVKYIKDEFEKDSIRYNSLYNYISFELGYNLENRFHIGVDVNSKKEITLFCRLLYIEKHF